MQCSEVVRNPRAHYSIAPISNPGMIGAFSEKLNDSQDLEISVFVRPK